MPNEIKPGQMPKEVIAAFREALRRDDTSFEEDFCAALNAWPGMHTHEWQRPWLGGMSGTDLILPLTENPDDKA